MLFDVVFEVVLDDVSGFVSLPCVFRRSDAMVERRYAGSGKVGDVLVEVVLEDVGACVSLCRVLAERRYGGSGDVDFDVVFDVVFAVVFDVVVDDVPACVSRALTFRVSDAIVERRYDGSGSAGDVCFDVVLDDVLTFVSISRVFRTPDAVVSLCRRPPVGLLYDFRICSRENSRSVVRVYLGCSDIDGPECVSAFFLSSSNSFRSTVNPLLLFIRSSSTRLFSMLVFALSSAILSLKVFVLVCVPAAVI